MGEKEISGRRSERTCDLESVKTKAKVGTVDALTNVPGVFPRAAVGPVRQSRIQNIAEVKHTCVFPRPTFRKH